MANKNLIDDLTALLLANYNLILTGAPGTGKTHLAKQIAMELTGSEELYGFVQFHPSYDYTDFVEGLRPVRSCDNVTFDRQDGIFMAFCRKALESSESSPKVSRPTISDATYYRALEQFANDYNGKSVAGSFTVEYNKGDDKITLHKYENKGPTNHPIKFNNLVEWLKGQKENTGHTTYEIIICKTIEREYLPKSSNATDEQPHEDKFVFIIDEINRGEISKIFGELFFAIDPGYRGEKGRVITQYNNIMKDDDVFKGGFYVPENVYIIGTMNNIDRSVDSLDFAVKRRFAWREIKADDTAESILSSNKKLNNQDVEKALSVLKKVNAEIEKYPLSADYHLGSAYFAKLAKYLKPNTPEKDAYEKLWEYHIEGIISEYFRGLPNAAERCKKIKEVFDGAVSSQKLTDEQQQEAPTTGGLHD